MAWRRISSTYSSASSRLVPARRGEGRDDRQRLAVEALRAAPSGSARWRRSSTSTTPTLRVRGQALDRVGAAVAVARRDRRRAPRARSRGASAGRQTTRTVSSMASPALARGAARRRAERRAPRDAQQVERSAPARPQENPQQRRAAQRVERAPRRAGRSSCSCERRAARARAGSVGAAGQRPRERRAAPARGRAAPRPRRGVAARRRPRRARGSSARPPSTKQRCGVDVLRARGEQQRESSVAHVELPGDEAPQVRVAAPRRRRRRAPARPAAAPARGRGGAGSAPRVTAEQRLGVGVPGRPAGARPPRWRRPAGELDERALGQARASAAAPARRASAPARPRWPRAASRARAAILLGEEDRPAPARRALPSG